MHCNMSSSLSNLVSTKVSHLPSCGRSAIPLLCRSSASVIPLIFYYTTLLLCSSALLLYYSSTPPSQVSSVLLVDLTVGTFSLSLTLAVANAMSRSACWTTISTKYRYQAIHFSNAMNHIISYVHFIRQTCNSQTVYDPNYQTFTTYQLSPEHWAESEPTRKF